MKQAPADSSEVDEFLKAMRECLTSGFYTLVPRRDHLNIMSLGGHHLRDCKDCLMRLTPNNYHAGPGADHDRNRNGDIWKFGASINKAEHYIKLKMEVQQDLAFLKVLSFHPAKFPLNYPHRRQMEITRPKIR